MKIYIPFSNKYLQFRLQTKKKRSNKRPCTNSVRLFKKRIRRKRKTCEFCGRGGDGLQIHHILPYGQYPHLMCNQENVILLCEECHKKIHSDYKITNVNINGNEILLKIGI